MTKLNFTKDAQRIGIWGASGSGKSTKLKQLLKQGGRNVVFDPMDEYTGQGFIRVTNTDQLKKALRKNWAGKFNIAYVPGAGNEIAELHEISGVMKWAQEGYKQFKHPVKITLAVEELNLSFPVNGVGADKMGFGDLCSRGRHYGINLIGISQRPAEVATRFRGNLSMAYIFRLAEHNDALAMGRMLGPDAKKMILDMPEYDFIMFRNGKTEAGRTSP